MAHRRTPPLLLSQKTESLEPGNDSDIDSGVWDDAAEDADHCLGSTLREEEKVIQQDEVEEDSQETGDYTVFVSFQGNMKDDDFTQKLDTILSGIPNMLDMG